MPALVSSLCKCWAYCKALILLCAEQVVFSALSAKLSHNLFSCCIWRNAEIRRNRLDLVLAAAKIISDLTDRRRNMFGVEKSQNFKNILDHFFNLVNVSDRFCLNIKFFMIDSE